MTSMTFTRRSPLTGITNDRTINCTPQQYHDWRNGKLIQEAMPQVSAEDREFIKTGLTPADWNRMYTPEPA